jgi:hypothetical protein
MKRVIVSAGFRRVLGRQKEARSYRSVTAVQERGCLGPRPVDMEVVRNAHYIAGSRF